MRSLLLLFTILCSLDAYSELRAYNDKSLREKRAEISLGFRHLGEFTLEGKESGQLRGQSSNGFLLEGGYNYTQKWFFGGYFSLNTSDYSADVIDVNGNPDQLYSTLSFFDLQFITRYNFLRNVFTPYIEAGLGMTSIDSGIASGNVVETCWWDPLFGYYVCGYRQTNKTITDVSATLGLGLRYEATKKSFLKLASSYRITNYTKTKERPKFWDITFAIGIMID
jgi:hypothetical protein